jgi:hypothetical protein
MQFHNDQHDAICGLVWHLVWQPAAGLLQKPDGQTPRHIAVAGDKRGDLDADQRSGMQRRAV